MSCRCVLGCDINAETEFDRSVALGSMTMVELGEEHGRTVIADFSHRQYVILIAFKVIKTFGDILPDK